MVEKPFIIALIITILFMAFRVVEMKFIDKEWKPMKLVVRDIIVVFLCSMLGSYFYLHLDGSLMDFMNVVTDNKSFNMSATQVFTDEPGF